MDDYRFPEPLREGVILRRPNRFVMFVRLGKRTVRCHCPATGRIGGIVFANVPCLVAKNQNPGTTKYTVRAISLDPVPRKRKRWIGIDQVGANRYIEHYLRLGRFADIFGPVEHVRREVPLGRNRIDFLLDDTTYVEVKSPLTRLPPGTHKVVEMAPMVSFDRLVNHFKAMRKMAKGGRALFLVCFQYDAPPFAPPTTGPKALMKVRRAASAARRGGVETWQVNLRVNEKGVRLLKAFPLRLP